MPDNWGRDAFCWLSRVFLALLVAFGFPSPGAYAAAGRLAAENASSPARALSVAPSLASPVSGATPGAVFSAPEIPDLPSGAATLPLMSLLEDHPAAARLFTQLAKEPLSPDEVNEMIGKARRVYVEHDVRPLTSDGEATPKELRVLAGLNRLVAEGMVRRDLHTMTPDELYAAQAAWDQANGRAVADVAIVGAGPGGLAAGVHAVAAGLKTVIFEGGFVAQSFSDAAMKSVYRMRTSAAQNSLVQPRFSPAPLVERLGMAARLKKYRARGQEADERLFRASGRPVSAAERAKLPPDSPKEPSVRNELLQHFADIARAIVSMGGLIMERAPVAFVGKLPEGLWVLRSNAGHVQLARKLILAQGQVGSKLDMGVIPQDIEVLADAFPASFLVLKSPEDLVANRQQLDQRQLIFHDSLLGTPQVEVMLARLAPRTRVMVVGSGQSAANAVLAVLRYNPSVHVDWFTERDMRLHQLQIPVTQVNPDFIRAALSDEELAVRSIREWQGFGVPITPAVFAQLWMEEFKGRVSIFSLGRKLTLSYQGRREKSVYRDYAQSVRRREAVYARMVRREGREVLAISAGNLEYFSRQLRRKDYPNLTSEDRYWMTEIDGPIISAVGYNREALRQEPLTRQLLEQGRIRLRGGYGKLLRNEILLNSDGSSAQDPDLYIIGAQNYASAPESAIPGIVARAVMTIAHIHDSLEQAQKSAAPSQGGLSRRLYDAARRLWDIMRRL